MEGNTVSTDLQVDATTESPKDSTVSTRSAPPSAPTKVDNISTPAHDDPPVGSSASRPTAPANWRLGYQRRLWITDFVALVWVVFGTQIAWFGLGNAQLAISEDSRISAVSYWLFSIGLVLLWMGALSWSDSRSYRVIGAGPTEYLRVADASLRLFGAIAIVAFLVKIDVARGFLLISLPLGIAVLLITRWLWRQWLIAMRERGTYSARVLLVGSVSSVAQIARELGRNVSAGYLVVGACTPSGTIGDTVPGTHIPMMGSVNAVDRAMQLTGADTVAVTSTDELPPDKVKQISWNLQAGR